MADINLLADADVARVGKGSTRRDSDIQAVTRCGQILRLLANDGSVRPPRVASELGLQRSTAYRYLTSMAEADLIQRDDDGAFVCGPLGVHLGALSMRRSQILAVSLPLMESLATEVHETVVLSLWDKTSPTVARVVEDPARTVNVSVGEGKSLPLSSAQGQVFLAFLDDQSLSRELVSSGSEGHGGGRLSAVVEQARTHGFGYDSMVVHGIHAVAVPVLDSRDCIAASLALVGTSDALVAKPEPQALAALRATAARIGEGLGYQRGDRA